LSSVITSSLQEAENIVIYKSFVLVCAVSAEDGAHEVLSYQLTCMGSVQPRSETSDEWVDVEMTDSEGEGSEEVVAV
jgi:hypothetical protein